MNFNVGSGTRLENVIGGMACRNWYKNMNKKGVETHYMDYKWEADDDALSDGGQLVLLQAV